MNIEREKPTTRGVDAPFGSSVLEPGVVLLRAPPRGSEEELATMLERVETLGAEFGRFALVLDLADIAERPKGRYLRLLRSAVTAPVHVAVVQPQNALLRIVSRFLFGRATSRPSFHPSRELAVSAARDAVAHGQGSP